MTKWEVIRRLAAAMETMDELSEAMRLAIIDVASVEDAKSGPEPDEPKPEPPDEFEAAAEDVTEVGGTNENQRDGKRDSLQRD